MNEIKKIIVDELPAVCLECKFCIYDKKYDMNNSNLNNYCFILEKNVSSLFKDDDCILEEVKI